jgi:catechol 2,3-dioxygenase-like lactoylglutathione lyase family enzyme
MLERTAQETMYYVRDLDAAVKFYSESLGLKLIRHYDWGFAPFKADDKGRHIGLMAADLYASEFPGEDGLPAPRLVFQVQDLDAQVEEFTAKGIRTTDVMGEKGETRAFHFFDLDGNAFFVWEEGQSAG